MPNKTIYIKDSDLPIWNRAQKELGESISSLFAEYLKKRLEIEAIRKKAKKEGRISKLEALNVFLAETNAGSELDIELHPFWNYPILDINNDKHGYKLHQKGDDEDRIISLVVSPFNFENSGELSPEAQRQIKDEIKRFWDGKTTERHRLVDISGS